MFASWRILPVVVSTTIVPLLGSFAFAQQPAAENPPAQPVAPAESQAEPSTTVREQNSEHLQDALKKLEASGSDSEAVHEVAFYQSREAVFSQQEAVEQQIKDLQARKVELEKQLKSPPPSEVPTSISFIELDQRKDELAAQEARLNLATDKLAATKNAVEKARVAYDESQVKRRQAYDERDAAKDKPNHRSLTLAAEQARLSTLLATDIFALRKREFERNKLAHEVQTLLVQVQRDQIARLSSHIVFTKEDYQQQLDDIKAKEDAANELLRTRQEGLRKVNEGLGETQEQYDAAVGDRTLATEKLEAERRARERLADEIDCLTQRLQRLAQLRVAWSWRYRISSAKYDEPDLKLWSELKDLQKETKGILGGLSEDLRMDILRMRDLRNSLTAVTKKIEATKDASQELEAALHRQQYQLELTLRIHERNLVMIETSRRVHEKLLDEIGLGVEGLTPKNLAYGAWHRAERIWNFEIGSIDKEYPITVRKVVGGVAMFITGWLLARFLASLFAYRLLKRFRMSRDATAAIRTLVFYVLLAIFVLHALRTIGIPLTAFTILGGALAIGVGFGSQTLVNNFIGGLIMLAERPVRLGERIAFGKFEGVVDDVGFRCTKLRTPSDHLVTIPNSTLVNESIENIDRRRTIRRVMNLQVSYNSTPELMQTTVQTIRDILEEKEIRERIHPIVGFEELPPKVYFTDFNAESLNIQVTYWYAPVDNSAYMKHCERVNLRIMEEFDRLGVQFAFPAKTNFVKNQAKRGASTFAA